MERLQALDRGLRLLALLAEEPAGITVTELAGRLDTPRPVVYRVLATLEEHGYARRDAAGRARLGLAVLHLATRVVPLMRAAATPVLRALAEDVRATAHLTLADGNEAFAVAVVEPTQTDVHVAYRVGTRHSLHAGAAGRAILAGRQGSGAAVATSGELQPGAFGVAAAVLGVHAVEASVGVVDLSPLPAAVGPRVERAAVEVAARLG